jgi:deoxycytidylate deaminase
MVSSSARTVTVIDTTDRVRSKGSKKTSAAQVQGLAANELVFAVVGPVGAGPTKIATQLEVLLQGAGFETSILSASEVIQTWAKANGELTDEEIKAALYTTKEGKEKRSLAFTRVMQNLGDKFRETTGDNAAVALELIKAIRKRRGLLQAIDPASTKAIKPDGTPRAFILDSIRHPDEVSLLRRVYQEAFWLVGVFCHEKQRELRLIEKYDGNEKDVHAFMSRDENAPEEFGQKVAEAFHLADYFVDNTPDRPTKIDDTRKWDVSEQLGRLLDILLHKRMTRPRLHETGMFHAYGARMRSSCLSRQVGAALVSANGDLIATGTNEVPRAGGGTLGESVADQEADHRCFASNRHCSNVREQNEIIESLLADVPELKNITIDKQLLASIRRTRIGQLVEFSRAVHAEMDSLLSAARSGVSTVGSRLYVTTFPCHSCARHIIAAGVVEVQYIEPYFQSRTFRLHADAVTDDPAKAAASIGPDGLPRKVLFRPFIGVAPRLYRRAFYKDRKLKDLTTGEMLDLKGAPDGPASTEVLQVSYAQVEAFLARQELNQAEQEQTDDDQEPTPTS